MIISRMLVPLAQTTSAESTPSVLPPDLQPWTRQRHLSAIKSWPRRCCHLVLTCQVLTCHEIGIPTNSLESAAWISQFALVKDLRGTVTISTFSLLKYDDRYWAISAYVRGYHRFLWFRSLNGSTAVLPPIHYFIIGLLHIAILHGSTAVATNSLWAIFMLRSYMVLLRC